MRLQSIRRLALAAALFLPGLQALHVKSELGIIPHSLEIRGDKFFTEEEDKRLIELKEKNPKLTWTEIAKYFPDHGYGSVKRRYQWYLLQNAPESQKHYQPEEDELLIQLRGDGLPWAQVADTFAQYFPRRSVPALAQHYNKVLMPRPGRPVYKPYTPDEDQCLIHLREQGLDWDEIAKSFAGRSASALRSRWDNRLKQDTGRRPTKIAFTQKEDQLLIQLKERGLRWDEIARHFEDRSLATLKNRWKNYLRPELGLKPQKIPFTPEEDRKLIELIEQDLDWDEILKSFEGRTIVSLQSRWHNHLKPKKGPNPQ